MRALFPALIALVFATVAHAQSIGPGGGGSGTGGPMIPLSTLGKPNGPAQLDGAGTASAQTVLVPGGVARSLSAQAGDVFNVKNFGADASGTNDSTAAFADAFAGASANPYGGTIYVPAGRYLVAATLVATINNNQAVNIQGDGPQFSEIDWTADVDGIAVNIGSAMTTRYRTTALPGTAIKVSGLSLVHAAGTSETHTALAIHSASSASSATTQSRISDVIMRGNGTSLGWLVGADYFRVAGTDTNNFAFYSGSADTTATAISITTDSTIGSIDHHLSNLHIYGGGTGIYVGPFLVQGVHIVNGTFVTNGLGVNWDNSPGSAGNADLLDIAGSDFGCPGPAVQVNFVRDILLTGDYFIGGDPVMINAINSNRLIIAGSSFGGHSSGTQQAIVVNNTAPVDNSPAAVITGNSFWDFTTVPTISLLGATNGASITGNHGTAVTLLGQDVSGHNNWFNNPGWNTNGVDDQVGINGTANNLKIAGSDAGSAPSLTVSGTDPGVGLAVNLKTTPMVVADTVTGNSIVVQPGAAPLIRGSGASPSLQITGNGASAPLLLGVVGATGGPTTFEGATADTGPRMTLTGSLYLVPKNLSFVRFVQTGTVATQTIDLPTALADGQPIQMDNYAGAITALTFSPAVNGFTNGSTFAANSGLRIRWDATASAWQREQ